MTNTCVFCDYTKHATRIVYETTNFYAVPTIGQISDGGYMLVIPKYHYACLGSMEDDKFGELEDVVSKLKTAITTTFGKPILFEHGILGQSITHAHLHLVPFATDIFPIVQKDFPVYKQITCMHDLRELHRTNGGYLFYQNPADEMFGFLPDAVIPQYFRIVVAEASGRQPRGDWRAWRSNKDNAKLDDKLIEETVKKLRQELQPPTI